MWQRRNFEARSLGKPIVHPTIVGLALLDHLELSQILPMWHFLTNFVVANIVNIR